MALRGAGFRVWGFRIQGFLKIGVPFDPRMPEGFWGPLTWN